MLKLREDPSPHPRRWWHVPLLLILFLGTIYVAREYNSRTVGTDAASPWTQQQTQKNEGAVFGTFYHLTYRSEENLQAGVDSVLADVDHSLSPFNPHSVITAINENRSMQADSHFSHVFLLAQHVYEATDGAFDITVAPLVNAWGFGFLEGTSPDSLQIDSIRQFVGMDKVQLLPDSTNQNSSAAGGGIIHKTDSRVMLDCSAIAKGYGVDAVASYFQSKGIRDYMVEIGGEIRLSGCNPQGEAWHIGVSRPIADPMATETDLQEVLELSNTAVATSGNYRNYREQADGSTIGHTIDPRIGRPVQRNILSATVLAADCATADAYATAFMVLGIEETRRILTSHPDIKAYLICIETEGDTPVGQYINF